MEDMTLDQAIEILNCEHHRGSNKRHPWFKDAGYARGPDRYDVLDELEAIGTAKELIRRRQASESAKTE